MEITPEIAEAAGIHAGDGYLRYRGKRRELDISGGFDEKGYYDDHVIPLFNRAFNLNIVGKFFRSRNTYGFVIRDREVLDVFRNLGFPSGKKSTIVRCPAQIKESVRKDILCAFLRGYFDTDGCLSFDRKICNKDEFKKNHNFYPRLLFSSDINLHLLLFFC